jgi:hypothetical protein
MQFYRNQPQQIEAQVLQWVMKGQRHEQEGSQTLELYSVWVKEWESVKQLGEC